MFHPSPIQTDGISGPNNRRTGVEKMKSCHLGILILSFVSFFEFFLCLRLIRKGNMALSSSNDIRGVHST